MTRSAKNKKSPPSQSHRPQGTIRPARDSTDQIAPADIPAVILLVDDDPDCRLLVRDAIAAVDERHRVYECIDGREGLRFLRRTDDYKTAPRPTVVFLDLDMPVMGGQEVLRELRADPSLADLPVVVLTGVDDDASERRALSNGANSYTFKGRNPDVLFDNVASATAYWTRVHRRPAASENSVAA